MPHTREAFYVVEGQVQFQLDAKRDPRQRGQRGARAGERSALFRNTGRGNVDWIVVTAPPLAVTLVEEVGAVAPGRDDSRFARAGRSATRNAPRSR